MLGFSIQKILFTVAVIAAIWYGFKWVGRMQARKKELAREQARRMKEPGAPKAGEPGVEEMVECPHCGAFVPDDGSHRCDEMDRA